MKRPSLILIACGGLALLAAVAIQGQATQDQEEQRIKAVINRHFEGVIQGSEQYLKEAWDVPSGHLKTISSDGKGSVRVEEIAKAIQRWTKEPSPDSSGKILSIDRAADRMAGVKIQFVWKDQTLTEFLTLFKIQNEWKIVNKSLVQPAAAKPSGGY
jgi:hypothetical protein